MHPGLRPTPSGSRRPTRGEVRPTAHRNGSTPRRVDSNRTRPRRGYTPCGRPVPSAGKKRPVARIGVNLAVRPFGLLTFTPERFHVLLNSLFKVLFNFPSRYLFAIGLVVIFSLRWSLPPTLSCTLKQPDSKERSSRNPRRSYGPGTLYGPWPHSSWTWTRRESHGMADPP